MTRSLSRVALSFGVLWLAAIIAAVPAAAMLVPIVSYDMPNGDGMASGGTYNYWDTAYSNCIGTNCTTDSAPLAGGKGLLTDGFIPTDSFFGGNGFGAYVGWAMSPTITLHLGAIQDISEIKLYVDNSAISDVSAPASVVIDGATYSDPSWASATGPETLDIVGLALSQSDVTLTLNRDNVWVFLGEVQLIGPSPGDTPLPASLPLMLGGGSLFAALACRHRRRALSAQGA